MFERITLEMSIKPFYRTDEAFVREVCDRVFTGWRQLLKDRREISVMLWASDGSELLDWAGDETQTFEWAKYIGTANKALLAPDEDKAANPHEKKQLYREDAPDMTYATLKRIVRCLHEEGRRLFPDSKITVGTIFDIGPEFAVSTFKYKRHTEICGGESLDGLGFVDAVACLHADSTHYAAFPDGIPEGTPFGTFLGAQANKFLAAMGFDYLWLSNGMGFSSSPWLMTGKVYDGEHFHPERLEDTRDKVFEFWRLFREACPDIPVKTRGTNNSAGIDYATDGVPLYDLYHANLDFDVPPNSPWAAINYNYGLEIMGHMTRVCGWTGKGFLFRYYTNDPWWQNSPWTDRYEGCAGDIYLPLSVTRILPDGSLENANALNLFTMDNSFGEIPEECINEPLPHLLKAEKDVPDAPGPLVWLYPLREYTTSHDSDTLAAMYFGDKYIMDCINGGVPLTTVISTDSFREIKPEHLQSCVLITPKQTDCAVLEKLNLFEANGGKVIRYGEGGLPYAEGAQGMLDALKKFGYGFAYETRGRNSRLPVLSLCRRDNAYLISACNMDTTTRISLSLPGGAPVLLGIEAEMNGDKAVYHFSRCEHRECRFLVTQNDGVVSAREFASVNVKYRRKLILSGLEDATVRFYPEKNGASDARVSEYINDGIIRLVPGWTLKVDENGMEYWFAEHVTGEYLFLMTGGKE